jgi:alkylhydroperoxidase family enzyme
MAAMLPDAERRVERQERSDTVAAVTTTARMIEKVLADAPDAARDLVDAYEAAQAALEPRLFNLVRLRVAMLLSCDTELDDLDLVAQLPMWPSSSAFTARERACLAYTEQFIIDVASMPDHLVNDATTELGDKSNETTVELIDFTHALLVIEQRQRLTLAWDRVLKGAN